MEQTPPQTKSPLVRQQKVVLRRIRAIDAEIRNGSYPNTNDLAKKLEAGVRTISRDLDEMRLFYNAPIAFDRSKNGYYYTENSFARTSFSDFATLPPRMERASFVRTVAPLASF